MYESVLEHWEKSPEFTEAVPESEILFKTVSSNLELIRKTFSRIEKKHSEDSLSRKKLRDKLCVAAGDLEMLLTENSSTMQYSYKKSYAFHIAISTTKESVFLARLQEIHDRGFENAKKLAKFGISSCVLVQFQQMIDSYEKNSTSKNLAPMRTLIKSLIRETDLILIEIDLLVEKVKGPHRKIVSQYKKKRIMPTKAALRF